jgi:hypothetical protein
MVPTALQSNKTEEKIKTHDWNSQRKIAPGTPLNRQGKLERAWFCFVLLALG